MAYDGYILKPKITTNTFCHQLKAFLFQFARNQLVIVLECALSLLVWSAI